VAIIATTFGSTLNSCVVGLGRAALGQRMERENSQQLHWPRGPSNQCDRTTLQGAVGLIPNFDPLQKILSVSR
jgi:hypothetical protein